jgi:ring-1,2-phenylacetyl-CoA epoxidase subunit PaaD
VLDARGPLVLRARALAACADVPDPELPVVTIADLGILRDVTVDDAGRVEVVVTPTYSGCPATEVIRADVVAALQDAGFADVVVRTTLSPAWTTDWITEDGRRKLSEHGIVPPSGVAVALAAGAPVGVALSVRCPQCGSPDTVLVSRFGATACQAMYRCARCLEPFDSIKPH